MVRRDFGAESVHSIEPPYLANRAIGPSGVWHGHSLSVFPAIGLALPATQPQPGLFKDRRGIAGVEVVSVVFADG